MSSSALRTLMGSVPRPVTNAARALRHNLLAFIEFAQDARRYMADCAPPDSRATASLTGTQLECQVTKDYHRVEKGLALSEPKPGFGGDVMRRLGELIPRVESTSPDAEYLRHAQSALLALKSWHVEEEIDDEVSPLLDRRLRPVIDERKLNDFFSSRRSVRNFDPARQVPESVIARAVQMAVTTPSVCNRQAWRAHVYSGAQARDVLVHQNGNRGFTDLVPNVAVITVDRRLFSGHFERNQRWVDGGLFAMNFVMSLHGLGVDTCMLNWSMSNAQSDALRHTGEIPESEDVIMLIAFGYAPEGYRVARSPRRTVDQVLSVHR